MTPAQNHATIARLRALRDRHNAGALSGLQFAACCRAVINEVTLPAPLRRWRVRGTLLATHHREVFTRGLDVADVAHDTIPVDLEVWAPVIERAPADAAWFVTAGYASWRWAEAPTVTEVPP